MQQVKFGLRRKTSHFRLSQTQPATNQFYRNLLTSRLPVTIGFADKLVRLIGIPLILLNPGCF